MRSSTHKFFRKTPTSSAKDNRQYGLLTQNIHPDSNKKLPTQPGSQTTTPIKKSSAPSKTFLLGEYIALFEGPALVLNSSPRFTLHITAYRNDADAHKPCAACSHPFHPCSPAAQYIDAHMDIFSGLTLQFTDPHQGAGGLGASSAQFAMVLQFAQPKLSIAECIAAYRQQHMRPPFLKHSDKKTRMPSGVDVAAQLLGHIALIHVEAQRYQSFNWPFSDIYYCLIRTGQKIATHAHLSTLIPPKGHTLTTLNKIASQTIKYFLEQDAAAFCSGLQAYGDLLKSNGFITKKALQLIKTVEQHSGVLATKGCGALGADIVCALVKAPHINEFSNWITSQGWSIVSADNQSSRGLLTTEKT